MHIACLMLNFAFFLFSQVCMLNLLSYGCYVSEFTFLVASYLFKSTYESLGNKLKLGVVYVLRVLLMCSVFIGKGSNHVSIFVHHPFPFSNLILCIPSPFFSQVVV